MGVTKYLSIDGEILSERREGESQNRNYITDAMGSVIEVYMGTSLKADATYTAFGGDISASWRISEYRFQWVGSWGYRRTGKDWMNTYVRARHYSTSDGGWGSVDPLWPDEAAYRYVEGRVTSSSDASGKGIGSTAGLIGTMSSLGARCPQTTNDYQKDCNKTGNKLSCCAAKVSGAICGMIAIGELACITPCPTCLIQPLWLICELDRRGACVIASHTQCQNSCMSDLWKIRSTPRWRRAIAECRKYGQKSKRCCVASVIAEQDGYNRCAPKCFPTLGGIPMSVRVAFALDTLKCCG